MCIQKIDFIGRVRNEFSLPIDCTLFLEKALFPVVALKMEADLKDSFI